MFTQEDKQEILAAIGSVREIAEGNRTAIEGNREAIGSLREVTEGNREAIVSVREIAEGNRAAIVDNAEAIALLAEQVEEHRTETRRSFAQVREHVDRRVLDLEVKIGSPTRYASRQVHRVVEKLHEKRIFTADDVTEVLSMSAFSKEA